jgi:hypothetical protein
MMKDFPCPRRCGVHDLILAPPHEQFAVTATRGVNSVLFIVVVLELVRMIVARLEGGGFQLQPFLDRRHLGNQGHPHGRCGAAARGGHGPGAAP